MRRAASRRTSSPTGCPSVLVDLAELVEVREDDADRSALAARALALLLEQVEDRGVVPGARDAVARRLDAQRVLRGLQRQLDLDDPGARPDTRPRLDRVERREEKVVGAPVDAVEQVLLAAAVDEQEHVGGRQVGMEPQLAADVDAEHALHAPGEDGEDRHALRLELGPRVHAVAGTG